MNRLVGYTAGAFIALGLVLLTAYAYYLYAPLPHRPSLSGHTKSEMMRIGTRVRHYIEYAPADLPPGAPLVIVLHGRLMTGSMMREMTGYEFDQAADKNHFAVLYPDGYRRSLVRLPQGSRRDRKARTCRRSGIHPRARRQRDRRSQDRRTQSFHRRLFQWRTYGDGSGRTIAQPRGGRRGVCDEPAGAGGVRLSARHIRRRRS